MSVKVNRADFPRGLPGLPGVWEYPEVETEVRCYITPDDAKALLTINRNNRNIKELSVAAWAGDMKEGNWPYTGFPIVVDSTGTLRDGQHRLRAVIKADVPVLFKVIYGLAPTAADYIDLGSQRTAADILKIRTGTHYSKCLGAAARLAMLWEDGRLQKSTTEWVVSKPQIVRYVEDNPDLITACEQAMCRSGRIEARPSAVACAWWILGMVDDKARDEFFEKLTTLVGLEEGDPILALFSRLRQGRMRREVVEARQHLNLILRAWEHWRKGKSIASLAMPKASADFPKL